MDSTDQKPKNDDISPVDNGTTVDTPGSTVADQPSAPKIVDVQPPEKPSETPPLTNEPLTQSAEEPASGADDSVEASAESSVSPASAAQEPVSDEVTPAEPATPVEQGAATDELQPPETNSQPTVDAVVEPSQTEPVSVSEDTASSLVGSVAPTESTAAPAPDSGSTPTPEATPDSNPMAATPKAEVHSAMLTIIAAVAVALVLATVAIVMYVKTNGNDKQAEKAKTSSTSAAPTSSATPKVTNTDVGQVSQEIDSSLNSLNDSTDFNANSISDTSLGL